MTDKKFTDEEIKKALVCCLDAECYKCPLLKDSECRSNSVSAILELINRYEAEIEKTRTEIVRLHNILLSFTNEVSLWSNKKGYDTTELSLIPILNEANNIQEEIKSEAIKEFAEKLTHTLVINNEENTEYFDFAYTLETIDNLVKEMAEGQK